ncbi:3-oxoadipate enol-lactonase [Cupriavidus basilensis]|uniref:3-oxoadipate enol-lactonase n=1 Tax=Cupriavidus basilensis TaxID=68895 RepID=A0ABT6AU98_9BURK|nr:3-oxoadipate enol-lactonase [Cupriavidus basilensis]MDF3836189.1 3-oxoadipate enol-lactonase [Cupriavidus basilensis]
MSAILPPSESRRVRVGDVSLQVRIDGGDGPWVILAHALGANHALWDATAQHLAPRYRVLRYDLRGHGQSDAPIGAYSMIRLADDVAGLMDALEVPEAHFAGVSVGGMVGQTVAVRHPERLMSLTLVDTVNRTPLNAHAMWHERIGHVEAHGMAGVADSTLQRWLSAPYRGAHPEEVERVREMILSTPVHGYVGTALAIMAFDLAGAIARIHCPTLVVVGEEDEGAPPAMAREIAATIPGARLEILPQAAHLAHLEQAGRFHAALDAFLGNAACGAQCAAP